MSDNANPTRPLAGPVPIRRGAYVATCFSCSDTGAIIAYRKDMLDAAPFAFSCVCDRAVKSGRPYPRWSAMHDAVYTRDLFPKRGTT